MSTPQSKVQVCSSILEYQIVKNNLATTLPRFYHYRKPEIKRTNGKIYIEYWYRIPIEKQDIHSVEKGQIGPKKKWKRFRIREDINRRGAAKEQYAEWLRSEIEESLKRGYNPFNTEAENSFIENGIIEEKKELNATDAMLLFLETWNKRGLEKHTIAIYTKVVNRFIDWLALKKIPYTEITNITQAHIETFLNDMKKEHGFGNREYNNHRSFLRTAFIFFRDKKHIADNPFTGISKMKAPVTKHRFFDKATLDKIIQLLRLKDDCTLLAVQAVYYLCVRSEKELKNLRVGNIFWEQNKILADVSKGKAERYIPMDLHIKEIFLSHGIAELPPNYYIFGQFGKPAPKPFGHGFYAKRFRKICNEAGIGKEFTLYGMKHSRVCDLKLAGTNDADIMSLTGHTDFTAYAKYLRDLGLSADIKNINAKSRKI